MLELTRPENRWGPGLREALAAKRLASKRPRVGREPSVSAWGFGGGSTRLA